VKRILKKDSQTRKKMRKE